MKRLIAIFTALFAAVALSARINVDAPSVVGLEEQFNITFTLTQKPSSFKWEAGSNFQVIWGPQTGSSTSVSIINGKTTRNSQYTYTYVLLPKAVGTFTLPAAVASVDGRQEESPSPRIEVVGNGAQQRASQPGSESSSDEQQNSQRSNASPESDIFMRFSLSRTSVVVGEPITATLKLFTRGSIAGFEDAKFPAFNGFWAQETEAPQNIEFKRESVGDRIYNTAVLRKWVLIPQKSGTIPIDPAELVCLVQQRVSSGNSIFDGFFDDYRTFRKRIVTSAYNVNVRPLPANAPASFSGAVGSFNISARLDKDSLKVHDAASLKVTVSGRGNVALVGAPKVNFPPDSEVYDTKTSEHIDKSKGGTSGSMVFEYPFIPRSHGDFTIDPIEFTYFDIESRKYVTLHTKPLNFTVARGEESNYVPGDGVSVPVSARKDVKNLSEDIHYISTGLPSLSGGNNFFIGTALFWIVAVLIVLLSAVAGYVVFRIRKLNSNVVLVRTRGASKAARKRLALANGYLQKGIYSAYYEELHKALLGYASDKLNIGAADLSKDGIAAAFASAGAPESLVSEYTALLDECEFARYAPAGREGAMKESYDRAAEVISSLDANMKTGKTTVFGAIAAILMLLSPLASAAQPSSCADSLWNSAVAAYAEGDFERSCADFLAIESLGYSSAELYTNIADAFYKQRNLPSAILYYERALKLNPSYKDARYNVEIARQFVQDRIDSVPEFFLRSWARELCYSIPSNVWTVFFLILLAIFCIMTVLFFLSRRPVWRRTAFFSAIAAILLLIPCAANAVWQKEDFIRRDTAIVFKTVCSAKSAPSGNTDLFVLHEGTKVRVLEELGEWTNIALSDGREGWVKSADITVI